MKKTYLAASTLALLVSAAIPALAAEAAPLPAAEKQAEATQPELPAIGPEPSFYRYIVEGRLTAIPFPVLNPACEGCPGRPAYEFTLLKY